jgi:parvulin-like peptidyl-prolyl isomerase
MLEHWMAVGGTEKQEVPEPPLYEACVAHLRSGAKGRSQSTSELKNECQKRYETLMTVALNKLVHAQWQEGEAGELGVKVSKADVEHVIAIGKKKQEPLLKEQLEISGQSLSDLRLRLRQNQLTEKIFEVIGKSTPQATAARFSRYYVEHKAAYNVPETRDLHIIRSASADGAQRVLGELRSGKSFASVAKSVSIPQPIATTNALLLGLTPTEFAEPVLAHAIFRAHPHELLGPVRIDLGYYVFEVTHTTPGHQLSLAEVKEQIGKELPELLRNQHVASFIAAFRKRWRARSDCRAGFVVEDCRQYQGVQKAVTEDPYTL